ncbi:unnamed protein product [Zymoseptoria tritici ST99CH_3D7]|uniref:HECT-type E3 ubiquitin transferase n=2 Tax=Zymoseptoria tritici TaxID=1047171 RepID=F9XIM9_ZYMTI|nr:uncharacterized protein MYCGRDRAFT_95327 [Zymoseptoria tritici IPO323]EGP85258.1 hypothetical protein MYCGRDRAFT_95327 [Zymoseptoria tritici IPO323]SMQ53570.1 unnamed protein product [Zymoseptoria tritici ST99CH_3D7]
MPVHNNDPRANTGDYSPGPKVGNTPSHNDVHTPPREVHPSDAKALTVHQGMPYKMRLDIRRDQAFLDLYQKLYNTSGSDMKQTDLQIFFRGDTTGESQSPSEWLAAVFTQMFDPNLALFAPTPADGRVMHPSEYSGLNPQHLPVFRFAGKMVGLAIRAKVTLPVRLSRAVLRRMLLVEAVDIAFEDLMEDLRLFDLERHDMIVNVLEKEIPPGLTFSIESERFGAVEVFDLLEDSRIALVNEGNKREYVRCVAEWLLFRSVGQQHDAFAQGVHDIVSNVELSQGQGIEELDRV